MLTLMGVLTSLVLSGDEVPVELKTLQERRDREIHKIDQIYKEELLKLKSKYMKNADLASANQVEAILKSKFPSSGDEIKKPPKSAEELVAFLDGTTWGTKGSKLSDRYTFSKNGEFKSSNRTCKFVATSKNTVTIIWTKNTVVLCEFSDDFSYMKELNLAKSIYINYPK